MLRALSLTGRLTIFFTAVAAAIVFGLGLVFIQATQRHFVDLDLATLQDEQRLIEGIVRSAGSAEDARQRLNEALSRRHDLYVLVRDARGATLYRSQDFPRPAAAAPRRAAPTDARADRLQQWTFEGREFRAIDFRVTPAYDKVLALDVLAAVDTEQHVHFLADLRDTLALYGAIAVAASGLLGWLAAHQGLAPLREMRSQAAAVSGHPFTGRMPVDAVPIEMAALAAELNAMLDRLQEDYRRLAEFSSDLAHELRTPISNLLTQTQVALCAKRDAPTYRDILASNAEELERMARMVADMLFLAKAERGIALPHRERFSAAPEVRALLEFYDAVAEDKGIRLGVVGDAVIDGDRLMFRRAIGNVLSNAVRHGDAGSPVSVSIAADAVGVSIGVENAADDIDPAILSRLFDRFFRVDPSRSHPASEGCGLGLSITKAIVEAHGGEVAATSRDRRMRVVLRFPAAPALA